MTSFYHKYGIYTFGKGIEGNPFITRFKTEMVETGIPNELGIEGNPFITRFKTLHFLYLLVEFVLLRIEGNPFITRFKTIALSRRFLITFLEY